MSVRRRCSKENPSDNLGAILGGANHLAGQGERQGHPRVHDQSARCTLKTLSRWHTHTRVCCLLFALIIMINFDLKIDIVAERCWLINPDSRF
jgi:hypothetical protein